MPATPLHYTLAFLVSKTDKRLSLPGLVVGSVIPDIEVPIIQMFFVGLPDHLFLHSLIGAITVGTLVSVIVTRYLYPLIISFVFRIEKNKLNRVCWISPWMVLSCLLGVLSHLVLDFPEHWYNPILWPWVNPQDIVGPLVLVFMQTYDIWTSFLIARLVTHIIMLVVFFVIIVHLHSKGNLWFRFWVGDPTVTESIRADAP
jgi:hypothetical protein